MNVGDSVLYTENGKTHVASVLEIRELENHSGKNGEPLLHLGYFAPYFAPGTDGIPTRQSIVGTHRQGELAQFRLDVAHETHSFDEKLKLPSYPGGRWKEATVVANPAIFSDDLETVEETHTDNSETHTEGTESTTGSTPADGNDDKGTIQ